MENVVKAAQLLFLLSGKVSLSFLSLPSQSMTFTAAHSSHLVPKPSLCSLSRDFLRRALTNLRS